MTNREILLTTLEVITGGLFLYIIFYGIKLIDQYTGLHLYKAYRRLLNWYASLVAFNYNERYTVNGKPLKEIRTLKDKDAKQYQDQLLKLRVPPGHRAYRLDTRKGRLQRLDLEYKEESKAHTIESLHPYGFLRILEHSYYFTALNDFNANKKIRKKLNLTAKQWQEKQKQN